MSISESVTLQDIISPHLVIAPSPLPPTLQPLTATPGLNPVPAQQSPVPATKSHLLNSAPRGSATPALLSPRQGCPNSPTQRRKVSLLQSQRIPRARPAVPEPLQPPGLAHKGPGGQRGLAAWQLGNCCSAATSHQPWRGPSSP